MTGHGVSRQTLRRLPLYLSYLKSLSEDAPDNVSSTGIAEALGLNPVQVRKDLASVASGGRPRIGYITRELIEDIEAFMGYSVMDNAVIVGAGRLGKAFLSYEGFTNYGLNILAAFDADERVMGMEGEKRILPMDQLKEFCQRMDVRIGIITVPACAAQQVCDLLVDSGMLAIWNFAPVRLTAPSHILVQNENMASSLALLSQHLAARLYK